MSTILAPLPTHNSLNFYKSVIYFGVPIPPLPFNFKMHQNAYFFQNFPKRLTKYIIFKGKLQLEF